MAEAIILVGLPGSGKTTYYRARFEKTHALVSGDVHGSMKDQMALVKAYMERSQSFVVDNTNVTCLARAPFIREAKAVGYRVVACYFDVPVRTAIGRNNHRKDKKPIPVPAILRGAKYLQLPTTEEGLDEVRVIREPVEAAS